jgi:hypothetical protein
VILSEGSGGCRSLANGAPRCSTGSANITREVRRRVYRLPFTCSFKLPNLINAPPGSDPFYYPQVSWVSRQVPAFR